MEEISDRRRWDYDVYSEIPHLSPIWILEIIIVSIILGFVFIF